MTRQELLSAAKPILFSTDMVRAIQEERKAVTRRVIKPQPEKAHTLLDRNEESALFLCGCYNGQTFMDWEESVKMPRRSGDILWVRETWAKGDCRMCRTEECVCFPSEESNYNDAYFYRTDFGETQGESSPPSAFKWRPSIHMPKEAARIFLRVTDVRVERLRDITEEQAKAEGVSKDGDMSARDAFKALWDSLRPKEDLSLYCWDANPWVWVIWFERMEPT